MIDYKKLSEILKNNNEFLITTHVNPDADAIGSQVATYLILKKLNKTVHLINHSETPYNLQFLDIDNKIEKYDKEKHAHLFNEVDVIVAVDFNRAERTVSMKEEFLSSNKTKITIDHHQDIEDIFDYVFCDIDYSATGHIIYEFIKQTNIVKIDYDIALQLYAAIMTDTGSFRFERTTPEIHRIAAELLEYGIVPGDVFDKIYSEGKLSKIKLLARALESIQTSLESDEVAYMVLRREDFDETGADESDTEGFVNFTMSIENVKIGMLFLELKKGFKVSFRSKGTLPMNKLAAEFGGGGHINAAGARLHDSSLEELQPEIIKKATEYLTK